MSYPHKISVKEISVPAGSLQVVIETDLGNYKTSKEFYSTREEFLQFWKPIIEHYEWIKYDSETKSI